MSKRKTLAPETFTVGLRSKLLAKMDPCPTCQQPRAAESLRVVAKDLGVAHSTLWRFLQGKSPSARLVDKLVVYLGLEVRP
jgi:transcriptional regulator with XRE-family HTH domain